MTPKNIFKQQVIRKAVQHARGITHQAATKQVEETFRLYPSDEEKVFEHCSEPACACGNRTKTEYNAEAYGAKVGEWSFGGDEFGFRQMWLTATNDGTIAATAHIQKF